MLSRLNPLLSAAFFFLVLALAPTAALAESPSHEIPTHIEPELKSLGINAANSTILDKGAKGNPGPGPAAVVFISFEQPFYGEMHLRGYNKDNTEIARSALLGVNKKAEEGGHVTFSFDAATKLEKVAHFTLMGEKRQGTPPKPAPREESIGEETKSIIKELLR